MSVDLMRRAGDKRNQKTSRQLERGRTVRASCSCYTYVYLLCQVKMPTVICALMTTFVALLTTSLGVCLIALRAASGVSYVRTCALPPLSVTLVLLWRLCRADLRLCSPSNSGRATALVSSKLFVTIFVVPNFFWLCDCRITRGQQSGARGTDGQVRG